VLVLAALQFALPFALIAWAAQHLASSLVGFLIATEPLLVAALAGTLDARERGDPRSGAGMLAGLAGVGLLLGLDVEGTASELLAAAAVLLATACYAAAGLLLGRLGEGAERRDLLPAALRVAAVLLLPAAAPALPGALPGLDTTASLLALGALCTALAFPVWFALIDRAGARQAALVTYVNPVVALALGAAVLGEPVTGTALAGLALILTGTWLGTRPGAATPSVEPVAARATTSTLGPDSS